MCRQELGAVSSRVGVRFSPCKCASAACRQRDASALFLFPAAMPPDMRPWHTDDLPTERDRYCGATQPGKGAQCATSDSKGSWRIWDTSACIARCALCAQCHHVSHGTDGDCSWFRKCLRLYESASIHGKPPELTHDTYRVRDSRGLLLPSIATADQWVQQCQNVLGLDATRWNNCPVPARHSANPLLARKLQRGLRSGSTSRLLLVGDSVMRDLFTTMACLLLPALELPLVSLSGLAVGQNGIPIRLPLKHTNTSWLGFLWFHQSRDATEAEKHALRDADAVVLSAGAHFMTADSMRARLSRAAATPTFFSDGEPRKRFAVLEYSPVHFAGTEDSEYHPGLHNQLQNSPRTCVPHNLMLSNSSTLARSWRRQVLNEFAHERALPVIRRWNLAAPNFDDHPPPATGFGAERFGTVDCRHFCSPGRTTYAVVDALSEWVFPQRLG